MKHSLLRKSIALLLALALLVACVPALASYSLVARKTVTLYADPYLTTPVARLPKYTSLRGVDVAYGVAKLRVSGKTCYTRLSSLVSAGSIYKNNNLIGFVTDRDLYVFSYPSTSASRVRLPKGTKLWAVGAKKGWGMVLNLYATHAGYVRLAAVN